MVFAFGLVSAVAEKSPITAPMVFVAAGILAGPLGLDLFEAKTDSEGVQLVASITLILVLFTDASTIDLQRLRNDYRVPLRLLGIGVPLTMVLGMLVAIPLFPGMSLWLIALMAFIFSPTDAALGQAVVTSKTVPDNIRDSIGVESGLNDGIALPPIMACLAAVGAAAGTQLDFGYWGHFHFVRTDFDRQDRCDWTRACALGERPGGADQCIRARTLSRAPVRPVWSLRQPSRP